MSAMESNSIPAPSASPIAPPTRQPTNSSALGCATHEPYRRGTTISRARLDCRRFCSKARTGTLQLHLCSVRVAMGCPECGQDARQAVAPGWWRCTATVVKDWVRPLDPRVSGMDPVYGVCDTEYAEGS